MAKKEAIFTVSVPHIVPGIVLDFNGVSADSEIGPLYVREAEVISIEAPDSENEAYGLWVSPEAGTVAEAYVRVSADWSFKVAG